MNSETDETMTYSIYHTIKSTLNIKIKTKTWLKRITNTRAISGGPEEWEFPVPLVAPVVLLGGLSWSLVTIRCIHSRYINGIDDNERVSIVICEMNILRNGFSVIVATE